MTVAIPHKDAVDQPSSPARPPNRRRFGRTRTTPGVLGVVLVALVLVSLGVGAVCALSLQYRDQTLQNLSTTDGELHAAAEEFHRALTAADVAAGAAFLARDQGMAEHRVRYETDYEAAVGEAQSALATLVAAAGAQTLSEQRDLLGTLPGRLSEYTVLVEDARGYNRLGKPVASTYQLLAADVLRAHLLPAARQLHTAVNEQLAGDQHDAAELPVLEIVLGLFLLLVLIGVQVYLWRRTNRVFNVGLAVAGVAAVTMLVWITAASMTAGQSAERSREEGSRVINALSDARLTALAARGNEALIPVAARDGHQRSPYEKAYQEHIGRLGGAGGELATAKAAAVDEAVREKIDAAEQSAKAWQAEHDKLLQASGTDQKRAVLALIDSEADAAFGALDDSLGGAIDETRQRFDTDVTSAKAASTGVVAGVMGLAALIAAGSAIGVWQRLREYR